MNIKPDELLSVLPAIGSTDGQGADAVALIKLFTPDSSWTWHITEASGQGDDVLMFGLVDGHVKELGYVSLNELISVRGPMGLPIERDLYWSPKTLGDIAPELFAGMETVDQAAHPSPGPDVTTP
jgi:hypothetical protein